QKLGQILRELGEGLEILQPGLTPLEVTRAQSRGDDGLEQPGLAVGRRPERAQVSRRGAELPEPLADDRHVDVALRIVLRAALDARGDQSVLLQLAGGLARDPRSLAQLGELDLLLWTGQPGRAAPPTLLRRGRRELLADHPEREELVALEPENRLQPLDVLLAEEAVPAAGAARRQQALVLEVADLRDGDVGE